MVAARVAVTAGTVLQVLVGDAGGAPGGGSGGGGAGISASSHEDGGGEASAVSTSGTPCSSLAVVAGVARPTRVRRTGSDGWQRKSGGRW